MLVLPSINEGFSNAILEAMASGKPVIATNSGGTPEAVRDGLTGILVPPCDSQALAKAMEQLISHKELAAKMGEEGRRRVESQFLASEMIEKIESLYAALLKRKLSRKRLIQKIYISARKVFAKCVKVLLFFCLYYLGFLFMAKKLGLERNRIKIMTFHRIDDTKSDPLCMYINLKSFDSMMSHIKKNFHVISLQSAVDMIGGNNCLLDDYIVITFDDGYRDNYVNAFPILKKYKIPATIFLVAGDEDENYIIWYDKVMIALKRAKKEILDLRDYGIEPVFLGSPLELGYAAEKIIGLCKKMGSVERTIFINKVLTLLGADMEYSDTTNCLLSKDEVIEMGQHGISFGSHGINHTILSILALQDAEREIRDSKKIILEKTGICVDFFAYPNGLKSDYSNEIIDLIKKHKYKAALTLMHSERNSGTLFELGRYCITQRMISGHSGKFSPMHFEVEISEIYHQMRKHLRLARKA